MAKYGQPQVDKPKPRNDVYTGLLAISLVAMLIGCALLFLDFRQYEDINKPKLPAVPPLSADAKTPPRKAEEPAKKEEGKKEEMKKDDAKKEEMKKDDAKKEEMKKDDAKKDAKKDDAKKDDGKE